MIWLYLLTLFASPTIIEIARNSVPDKFIINDDTRVRQNVLNLSYPNAVEKVSQEEFTMSADCQAVVSCSDVTQYKFEFTPVFTSGSDLRVLFRTTRTDYLSDKRHGIAVDFTEQGMKIFENGIKVATVDSVKLSRYPHERILLENFAGDYSITIGCNTVYRGHTTLHLTDALVFETTDSSSVQLKRIVRNYAPADME